MGKSSGATFSKIQVDIASNCCQMAKNDRILADERPLEHFLAILAHFMPRPRNAQEAAHQPEFGHFWPSDNNCLQYLPGFLKRWLLKICPFWPERHRKRVFWTPRSLETTRERKEKGGERGEKKKGLLALIIFILPTLEIVSERQKSARDTPLGHLNRAVPFSKIRVYIGMKWAKMAKKCSRGRSSARIRSFLAI